VDEKRIRRLDAATAKEVWNVAFPPGTDWRFLLQGRHWDRGDNQPTPTRARLVQPPPDLDGDGTADLVYASRLTSWLVAFSGKTGKLLWKRDALPDLPGGVDATKVRWDFAWQSMSLGMPLSADVDGDGTPDVIATFLSSPREFTVGAAKPQQTKPERWIEAVS